MAFWEGHFFSLVKRELKKAFTGYRLIAMFLAICFVLLVAAGVPSGETIGNIVPCLVAIATDEVKSIKSVAAVVGLIFVLALASLLIKKTLDRLMQNYTKYRNKIVIRAFEEWHVSSFLFILAGVALLWTGGFTLQGPHADDTLAIARLGFYKTVFVFTFLLSSG